MIWGFAFIAIYFVLTYHRASLSVWAISFALFLVVFMRLDEVSVWAASLFWIIFALFFGFFLLPWLRKKFFVAPVLKLYSKLMPAMSRTEREALSAGTVGWEGDLFSGAPDYSKLFALPKPELSEEEKAFINGPVEELCKMIDDWDITHHLLDMPQPMWDFLKKEGFFLSLFPSNMAEKNFPPLLIRKY